MLSLQTLVADLLVASPPATAYFLELRLDCIGCSMNKFCTLQELCDHYDFDAETFLSRLQARLNQQAE